MRRMASIAAAVALVAAATGCGQERPRSGTGKLAGTLPPAPRGLTLRSPAFAPGATIPRRHTCQGEGAAPPLSWSAPPPGTRELALLMEDADAPGGSFVHWVVFGLAPGTRGLPAGTRPATLRLGRAGSGKVGYVPPCPPPGARTHRYVFAVYAVRKPLRLQYGASAAQVRSAIAAAQPVRGTLVGRFGR